ncbi:MAG: hypothetical protein J0H34_22385 [Rhizobiales bacterium]|nr:hypothetical protein [Hyphomicrobiales bacterium]
MAEKKIGTRVFKVEPLLATEAIRLQMRLVKAIGPAIDRLPEIFAGIRDGKQDARERANSAAVSAVSDIIGSMDAGDATDLIRDIVQVAMVKRPSGAYEQVDLDGEFTGSLGDIIPVATFVLQEQFAEVFSGARGTGSPASRARA